jgi:hypothetical protein
MRRSAIAVAGAFLAVCSAASGAEGAPENAAKPRNVSVITATDETVAGTLVSVSEGALKVGTEPARSVSLADLQKLTFIESTEEAATTPTARWIGQDRQDFVQVGSAQGPNGVQDIHIRLAGLSPKKDIKQLRIISRVPPRAWRLDPSGSPDWSLVLQRANAASTADIYFEPPSGDLMDRELQLTLTYGDDSTEKLTCKATTHTSDQTKLDSQPKADPSLKGFPVKVNLQAGDLLVGALAELTDENLALNTVWQPQLRVPLLDVRGLVSDVATADAKKRYEQLRQKPGSEDTVIILAKDGTLADVAGHIKSWDGAQLQMVYEGEQRAIGAERFQAVVFAAHPSTRSAATARQVVRMNSGDVLSGAWQSFTDDKVAVETPWKEVVSIPVSNIAEISTRNGNLVQLSELEPVNVEQTPYFGRLIGYRADQSLDGGPLKLKGETYVRGLAVHSRCVLTYALDGEFAKFKTTVGFDDAAGTIGCVTCRVVGDGKDLFAKTDMKSADGLQTLDLPVAGVKELVLDVDFGSDEDAGDRIIWGEPRLFRK